MERSADTSFAIFPLVEQPLLVGPDPKFLIRLVVGVQLARQFPQVLTCVKEIDDLHRTWKVLLGEVPDPFGSIPHDHLLRRTAPAALPGFHIDTLAKLFGSLDGAGIGGR